MPFIFASDVSFVVFGVVGVAKVTRRGVAAVAQAMHPSTGVVVDGSVVHCVAEVANGGALGVAEVVDSLGWPHAEVTRLNRRMHMLRKGARSPEQSTVRSCQNPRDRQRTRTSAQCPPRRVVTWKGACV